MKAVITPSVTVACLVGIPFTACKTEKEEPKDQTIHGINLAYMDTLVSPKNDFSRFVNGKWLDANKIPEDQTNWESFAELRKKIDDDVLAILKKAVSDSNLV